MTTTPSNTPTKFNDDNIDKNGKVEEEDDEDDDEEDEALNEFTRALFSSDKGDNDDEEEDDDDTISKHIWTVPPLETTTTTTTTTLSSSPVSSPVSLTYHLAFLAPGHGDSLWNASQCLAEYLYHWKQRPDKSMNNSGDNGGSDYDDLYPYPVPIAWSKLRPTISMELGAGAALPSWMALHLGIPNVIVTDLKINEDTFDALERSATINCHAWDIPRSNVTLFPHNWGHTEQIHDLQQKTQTMMATMTTTNIKKNNSNNDTEDDGRGAFVDIVIASDCIYNPNYHVDLLKSATSVMHPQNGLLLVGYSFHGNVKEEQVLNFFEVAHEETMNLKTVTKFTKKYDQGQEGLGSDDPIRGAVHVQILAFADSTTYFS